MEKTVAEPKRPANVEYAVCVHFDTANEMNYKVDRDRTKRTTARQVWWDQRAAIFDRYVIPSLKSQNFQKFTLWGLFNKRDSARSESMRNIVYRAGGIVALDGPRALREHYYDHCEWLCVILLDSDDLYHPEAFAEIAKLKPEIGLACFFSQGWMYDLHDRKLYQFDARKGNPGPWLARWYSNDSLHTEQTWWEYRLQHGFTLVHWQIRQTKGSLEIPGQRCMGLIHVENTEKRYKKLTIGRDTLVEVVNGEKKEVISLFQLGEG